MRASLVISYNPDIELLRENLSHLRTVIERIIIVDNNSDNKLKLVELKETFSNVTILFLDKNEGIAKATNIGFSYLSLHTDWILLLDQDSILTKADIEELYSVKNKSELQKLAMVVPTYMERNIKSTSHHEDYRTNSSWKEVDFPIASGSLVSVKAWKSINGYDEYLFIDRVDDDFDIRLRNKGYSLIQAKNAVINHSIGKIITINLFGNMIKIYNHGSFRKYYQARNNVIFAKRYGKTRNAYSRNIILIFKTVLFEKNKIDKTKSIIRGIKDGIQYKK